MTQPIIAALAALAMGATPQPAMPSAAEAAFIARVTKSLMATVPTSEAAAKAGYMQLTGAGPDGETIWSTMTYTGIDESHPNFLWFDRHGKLVGLDYEYPKADHPKPPAPSIYPVAASRWDTVHEHAHFAYRIGSGPIVRHGAHALANLKGPQITAEELRADALLPKNAKLLWAHYHPACWDLGFWVVPNPDGAFAEDNPLVK